MRSFENLEIAVIGTPTHAQVLENIRRDKPCRADPGSPHCTFASAADDYLLGDVAGPKICQKCPTFDRERQNMQAAWEEWVLAMQEAYT